MPSIRPPPTDLIVDLPVATGKVASGEAEVANLVFGPFFCQIIGCKMLLQIVQYRSGLYITSHSKSVSECINTIYVDSD